MPPRSALLQEAISIIIINIPYTFQPRVWVFTVTAFILAGINRAIGKSRLCVKGQVSIPNGSCGTNISQKEKSCAQYRLPPSQCLSTFCYRVDHIPSATQSPCRPVFHCEYLYSLVVFLRRELQPQALSLLRPTLSEYSWVIVFHKGQDGDLTSRAKHRLEKLHIASL